MADPEGIFQLAKGALRHDPPVARTSSEKTESNNLFGYIVLSTRVVGLPVCHILVSTNAISFCSIHEQQCARKSDSATSGLKINAEYSNCTCKAKLYHDTRSNEQSHRTMQKQNHRATKHVGMAKNAFLSV